jgi:hypothetical protein
MTSEWTEEFVRDLNHSTKVLSIGTATLLDTEFPAVQVRNLYGQVIVWGPFGLERRKNGEFKKWTGRVTNDAATEDVVYVAS